MNVKRIPVQLAQNVSIKEEVLSVYVLQELKEILTRRDVSTGFLVKNLFTKFNYSY